MELLGLIFSFIRGFEESLSGHAKMGRTMTRLW